MRGCFLDVFVHSENGDFFFSFFPVRFIKFWKFRVKHHCDQIISYSSALSKKILTVASRGNSTTPAGWGAQHSKYCCWLILAEDWSVSSNSRLNLRTGARWKLLICKCRLLDLMYFTYILLQPIICFKAVLLLTGKIKNHAARDLGKYLLWFSIRSLTWTSCFYAGNYQINESHTVCILYHIYRYVKVKHFSERAALSGEIKSNYFWFMLPC